jgi:hypothetical protein
MGLGGAILGLAGGVFGSLAKNQRYENQQNLLNKRKSENQDWYNSRYYESPTQRIDAQYALTELEKRLTKRMDAAEGRKAVMGGTNESVAAEKEAQSGAMADTTAQIAAAGEARKDAIEQEYLRRKDKLDDVLLGIEGEKDTPLHTASAGIGGFAKGLGGGGSILGMLSK